MKDEGALRLTSTRRDDDDIPLYSLLMMVLELMKRLFLAYLSCPTRILG